MRFLFISVSVALLLPARNFQVVVLTIVNLGIGLYEATPNWTVLNISQGAYDKLKDIIVNNNIPRQINFNISTWHVWTRTIMLEPNVFGATGKTLWFMAGLSAYNIK